MQLGGPVRCALAEGTAGNIAGFEDHRQSSSSLVDSIAGFEDRMDRGNSLVECVV